MGGYFSPYAGGYSAAVAAQLAAAQQSSQVSEKTNPGGRKTNTVEPVGVKQTQKQMAITPYT